MTYLLDVSPLIALLWERHPHHQRVHTWQAQADLAVCPLTELGFLRIVSTVPAFGLSVREARHMLDAWKQARSSRFIPCDAPALETDAPPTGSLTTDFYPASLAEKHGMQLATLDESIGHRAAFVIPSEHPPVQQAS